MKPPFVVLAAIAAVLAGCAHYEPLPLSTARVQQDLEARSLDDPALRDYVRQHLHRAAPPWDLDALTAAAWYASPGMDQARAQLAVRSAAVITAGQRPRPTLNVPFDYNTTAKPGESPYTLGLGLDIPIETAGKRGYRVANAKALSLAARFDIGAVAWRIRQQLRAQLLALWDAGVRVHLLQEQVALRERLLHSLEHRLALGEAARAELEVARALSEGDRLRLAQARQARAEALAAAAGVIGLPASALAGQALDLQGFDEPARAPRRDALLDAALRNHADVQAQLARYEASQSALQLAVAAQYPDLHLGPGFTYDAGAHKLSLSLSGIPIPLPHDNEGPIAEATARRRLEAARVRATVASALAEVDRAFAAWPPAAAALDSARARVATQDRLVLAAAAALRAGEGDRTSLLRAELDAGSARLDAQKALLELQKVAGAIEDAVQRPVLEWPGAAPGQEKGS
ncbi:MAG: TolC family protein [Burkholderiales bacterium]|nr:TolC family protein [Burkholderiales bacterium]